MVKKFTLALPIAKNIEPETMTVMWSQEARWIKYSERKKKEMAQKLFTYLYTKAPGFFFDAFFEVIGETIASKKRASNDIWRVLKDFILTKASREAIKSL